MTPSELELIVARDPGAMARAYDEHAAGVRRYCATVCAPERVDEATAAAFVGFLARAEDEPTATLGEVLKRATREVAAARVEPATGRPVCKVLPELLAARANGELTAHAAMVDEHLRSCETCRVTAARLEQAEAAFAAPPGAGADVPGREAWLALAAAAGRRVEQSAEPPAATHDGAGPPSPPEPPRTRARRGGLVGAVRRLASQQRADQPESRGRGRR